MQTPPPEKPWLERKIDEIYNRPREGGREILAGSFAISGLSFIADFMSSAHMGWFWITAPVAAKLGAIVAKEQLGNVISDDGKYNKSAVAGSIIGALAATSLHLVIGYSNLDDQVKAKSNIEQQVETQIERGMKNLNDLQQLRIEQGLKPVQKQLDEQGKQIELLQTPVRPGASINWYERARVQENETARQWSERAKISKMFAMLKDQELS